MFCRFRPLSAWLSIALLAMDVVVGAAGHSHERHAGACAGHTHQQHATHEHACGHNHDAKPCDHEPSTGEQSERDQAPQDDCSLCRHFRQAAVVATISIDLCGSEFVEPLIAGAEIHRAAPPLKIHAARGPPSFGA